MGKGYIYIMTNPALQGMIKVGYTTNIVERCKRLSSTELPYAYEVYATYETNGKLEDKTFHKIIDKLNPDLRVTQNREFYVMKPEEAYELLESIAIISGTTDKLNRLVNPSSSSKQNVRKPAINFTECGIPMGAELVYTDDPSIKVTVVAPRKVQYKDEITSLSAVVCSIKGTSAVQGPMFFSYNGESLIDIANKTQWKDYK